MKIIAAKLPIFLVKKHNVDVQTKTPGIYYYVEDTAKSHNEIFDVLHAFIQDSINNGKSPIGSVGSIVCADVDTSLSLDETALNPIRFADDCSLIESQKFVGLDGNIFRMVQDEQVTPEFVEFLKKCNAIEKENNIDDLVRRLYRSNYEERIITKITRYLDSEDQAIEKAKMSA